MSSQKGKKNYNSFIVDSIDFKMLRKLGNRVRVLQLYFKQNIYTLNKYGKYVEVVIKSTRIII